MARPRVFAAARGCPGRCEHRPLQGVRRGGGMWFPGCPPARPSAVGADSISARVTLRRRGVARDDASIVPYRGCNNAGFEISRVAANPPLAVGADSISARVTLRRRGVARDDASIVPYRGCNNAGFEISRVAANPPLAVGADSISARGTLRRRGFSGAVAAFSQICRAGVHARRTTAISKWKRSRRRRARRDEGIPPYGRPGGDGNPFGRNVYHGSQGRTMPLPQNLFQHYEPPAGRRSTLSKL